MFRTPNLMGSEETSAPQAVPALAPRCDLGVCPGSKSILAGNIKCSAPGQTRPCRTKHREAATAGFKISPGLKIEP